MTELQYQIVKRFVLAWATFSIVCLILIISNTLGTVHLVVRH